MELGAAPARRRALRDRLLGTDVTWAAAPARGDHAERPSRGWRDGRSADFHLRAVTITEVEGTIARLRRQGAGCRAGVPTKRLGTLLHLQVERVLALAVAAARVRGFTLLARDARPFGHTGTELADPFEAPPALGPSWQPSGCPALISGRRSNNLECCRAVAPHGHKGLYTGAPVHHITAPKRGLSTAARAAAAF